MIVCPSSRLHTDVLSVPDMIGDGAGHNGYLGRSTY